MKIITILGARPQFIKAAVVSKILNSSEFNSNIGVSFNIHENLNLRGGYADNDGFTLGAGVKLNFIELDIAVLPSDSLHPFKPTQQFTVKLLVEKVLSASKRLSP